MTTAESPDGIRSHYRRPATSLVALLVEDNLGDARLLTEMLRESGETGLRLEQVATLDAALDRLEAEHFDVILLDLYLPDSHGEETFLHVHAHAEQTPIVVLSGLENESLALQLVQSGAQDYLIKGQADGRLVRRAVRYAIERAAAENQRRVLLAREQAARSRAEQLALQAAFLAKSGELLAGTLDLEETLQSIVRLVVPALGDCCILEVADARASGRRYEVAHTDPAMEPTLRDLVASDPRHRALLGGLLEQVAHAGEHRYVPDTGSAVVAGGGSEPIDLHHCGEIGIGSLVLAPLRTPRLTVGVLVVGAAEVGRRLNETDREIIKALARQAALAVENAWLYLAERTARAEAEIERAGFWAILENAPGGMIYVDAASGRLVWNADAIRLFGRQLTTEAGNRQNVGYLFWPDGRPLAWEELPSQRALGGQTIRGEEIVVRQPAGAAFPVVISAAPVRLPDGPIRGAVSAFQDISAVKDVERLRREWTSVVAHDLRQPVSVIKGFARILERHLEDAEPGSPVERSIGHIIRSADRLSGMINDLVDASRLETANLELRLEPISLPILVAEIVERLAGVTAGYPVRVLHEQPIPEVLGDAGRIEQVLGNLLSNAAKYADPATEIEIAIRPADGEAVIAVTNRGAGILPEELPRLFNRFSRTSATRVSTVEGLGLGLYITRGLVEAHGGRIWAESVPGELTTFRFSLPYATG